MDPKKPFLRSGSGNRSQLPAHLYNQPNNVEVEHQKLLDQNSGPSNTPPHWHNHLEHQKFLARESAIAKDLQQQHERRTSWAQAAAIARHNPALPISPSHHTLHQGQGPFTFQPAALRPPPGLSQNAPSGMNPVLPMQYPPQSTHLSPYTSQTMSRHASFARQLPPSPLPSPGDPPSTHQLPYSPQPTSTPGAALEAKRQEIDDLVGAFVERPTQNFMSRLGHRQNDPHFMLALALEALGRYKDVKIKSNRAVARLEKKERDGQEEEFDEFIKEILGVLGRNCA